MRERVPDRPVEVSVLERALANCVVFHDHFAEPGEHPVLVLPGHQVHPDLDKVPIVAASFAKTHLLEPWT